MKDLLNSPIIIDIWNWLVSEKGIETAVVILAAGVILYAPLIKAARFLLVWIIQSKPLSMRKWAVLVTSTEPVEKAAGFRASGPIYYTPESWPRFYLMRASNRVFADEVEYFSLEDGIKVVLIKQPAPDERPSQIASCNAQDAKSSLSSLYAKAARRT